MTRPLGYTLISGGGSGGSDSAKVDKYTTQAKTADFTAAPGFIYLIDSTAGAVVATLPAAIGSVELDVTTSGPTEVRLISSGTPKISVRGVINLTR